MVISKDLYQSFTVTGTAALAVVVPWIILKTFKAVTLKRSFEALMNKVVVITGASGGIGECLAHEYYKRGCQVVLCARRSEELERVKSDLQRQSTGKTKPPTPIVVPMDLSDIDSLQKCVDTILAQTGQIDILINNGGIATRGTIVDTKSEVHVRVMTVNYFGSIVLTKAVLPNMMSRNSGHIVFVGSVQSLLSLPYRSAYCASKHALKAFADSLRAEMASKNILVTSTYPGYVKTSITINALTASGAKHDKMDEDTEQGFSPEYVAEVISTAVAQKKEEIAICPPMHKFAIFLRNNVPSVYYYLMVKKAVTDKKLL